MMTWRETDEEDMNDLLHKHTDDCWCQATEADKLTAQKIAEEPDQAEVYATACKALMTARAEGFAAGQTTAREVHLSSPRETNVLTRYMSMTPGQFVNKNTGEYVTLAKVSEEDDAELHEYWIDGSALRDTLSYVIREHECTTGSPSSVKVAYTLKVPKTRSHIAHHLSAYPLLVNDASDDTIDAYVDDQLVAKVVLLP